MLPKLRIVAESTRSIFGFFFTHGFCTVSDPPFSLKMSTYVTAPFFISLEITNAPLARSLLKVASMLVGQTGNTRNTPYSCCNSIESRHLWNPQSQFRRTCAQRSDCSLSSDKESQP